MTVLLVRSDGLIFNMGLNSSYALELDAKHYPQSDAESTASSSESMDVAPADRTADPENPEL